MDKINAPLSCYLSRPVECSCIFGQKFSKDREIFRQLERRFVQIMERVSFMSELHTNDFTVVYQPFFKDATVFYQNDIKPDLSIMAIDCVHLSQKGHAVSANGKIFLHHIVTCILFYNNSQFEGIWNNMLEPVKRKSKGLNHLFEKFNCPSPQNPYIYTNFNS